MAAHTASAVAGATELTRSRTANNQMNVYKSEQETTYKTLRQGKGRRKNLVEGVQGHTLHLKDSDSFTIHKH